MKFCFLSEVGSMSDSTIPSPLLPLQRSSEKKTSLDGVENKKKFALQMIDFETKAQNIVGQMCTLHNKHKAFLLNSVCACEVQTLVCGMKKIAETLKKFRNSDVSAQ